MKQGWRLKKIAEVCEELFAGGDVPKNNYSKFETEDYKIPIFSNGEKKRGLYGYTNIIRVHKPSVTIAARGTIGYCEIRNEKFYPAVRLIVATPNPDIINLSFFKYLIGSIDFKYSGSSIPQLTIPMIKDYQLLLPPLEHQEYIVKVLDIAFSAMDKAKANAEQNLKNVKELFESYLQDVFQNKGTGWESKTLGEIAKVIGGYSFKSTDFINEGKYQVIRMGNVRPGIIRENESPVFIDSLSDNVLKRALLLQNDVIITQTGTKNKRDYGFTVVIEKDNFLLNQRISAIRFLDNYLPKFFLYFSWTNIFKDQYFANETGTVGQGNVGIGAITNAIIPYPSLKDQQKAVSDIEAVLNETKKLEFIYQQKINDLEELKKSVLQKAFNGKLKLEELETA